MEAAGQDGRNVVPVVLPRSAPARSVLTDTVISGARAFISKQSMIVLGSVDQNGGVWASVLFGKPGFLHTDTGKSILIDVPAEERDETDPFRHNIDANASIGMRSSNWARRVHRMLRLANFAYPARTGSLEIDRHFGAALFEVVRCRQAIEEAAQCLFATRFWMRQDCDCCFHGAPFRRFYD